MDYLFHGKYIKAVKIKLLDYIYIERFVDCSTQYRKQANNQPPILPATWQLTTLDIFFSINIIFSFIIKWSSLNLPNNCFHNFFYISEGKPSVGIGCRLMFTMPN
jgi:hypothetical protein